MSSYQLPTDKILLLTLSALLRMKRSFRQDAQAIIGRLDPPLRVAGQEYIPRQGPCLLTCNHNTRPAFGAWWGAMAISASLPLEAHWVMTAAWTFTDPLRKWTLGPLSAWVFRRLASLYDFTIMPVMPPRQGEEQARALAVRRLVATVRATPQPVVALAPEGHDSYNLAGEPAPPYGALPGAYPLGWPPAGAGRLIAHLHRPPLGLAIVPVAAYEDGGMRLRFGPAYALDLPADLPAEQLDRHASRQVMQAIARLLPENLRGEF
jgi:hypothetical protein